MNIELKFSKLVKYISKLESCAIGFSGGVDSTFLCALAKQTLQNNAIAFTF